MIDWLIIKQLSNNHFSYYLSYLGMNYSNVIGFLLLILYLLQVLSGIFLTFYYDAFYLIAFDSIYYINLEVNVGWLITIFHSLGASLFFLFIYLHLLRGVWIRVKFNIPTLLWITGLPIFLLSVIEGFLGYCLNWGQMSYWGITVIINIIRIIPLIGGYFCDLIWGSSSIITNRIYSFHYVVGLVIALFIVIHLLILHSFSSSNPFNNNLSSFNLSLFPIFIKDYTSLIFIACLIGILLNLIEIESLLGNTDNLIPANPLSTPINIIPEWYFLLYYGLLRSVPSKVVGLLLVVCYLLFVWL